MKRLVPLVLLVSALATAGCGRITYNYPALVAPETGRVPRKALLIAVQDQRKLLLSGKIGEHHAGIVRSWGPIYIESTTRKPLAQDLAESIARTLAGRGAAASPLRLSPTLNPDQARAELAARNPGLALFFVVRDLTPDMSAASGNTAVYYDLGLTVFDQQGAVVGSSSRAGKERYDTPRDYQAKITETVNQQFTALLGDPSIVQALK